ncbi:MAG: hypothetical protein ABII74_06260 [Elusimicrobiota bacterium]
MHKKYYHSVIAFLAGAAILAGIGLVCAEEKDASAPYVYGGSKYRDPLVSLIGKGLAMSRLQDGPISWTEQNLEGVDLKGIIRGGKERYALLKDAAGITYICKGSKVFDFRGQLVSGVASVIKEESVVFILDDKKVKEIKIRKDENKK